MSCRIDLSDNMVTAVTKLVEGNPGAVRVCMELVTNAQTIDPTHFAGSFAPLLLLDAMGIYGPNIWMLYKDLCDFQIDWTYAVLRALQLGIIIRQDLFSALEGRKDLNVESIIEQVKQQLPELTFIQEGM